MKVDVEKLSGVKRTLQVNLEWSEIADQYQAIFQDLRKRLKVDGFRPGKVPESVAWRQLRPQVKSQFGNRIIEDTLPRALTEQGIQEYLDLKVIDLHYDEEQPFVYKVEVEMDPEVGLPPYEKGFKVVRNEYIVDPASVDAYLEDLRGQAAEIQEITTGAQEGHYLLADIQELDATGVPLVGRKLPGRLIKVGEGMFGGPGAANLRGVQAGAEVQISVENEKKQTQRYAISVKRVEQHTLPELTDDFVQAHFKDLKTYTELRQRVEEKLQNDWQRQAEDELARAIADYFVDNADLEVPEFRVQWYLDKVIENLKNSRKNQPQTLDEQKIRDERRPAAERNVRWYLIQRAIRKQAGIQVSEAEIDDAIARIRQGFPENQQAQVDQFYHKRANRLEVEMDLADRKVIEHLKQFIKEKKQVIHTATLT